MPSASLRLSDLLRDAYALTDPAARRELVDRECAEDVPLRRQLDDLLHVADELQAVFGRPPNLDALAADLAERAAGSETLTPAPNRLDGSGEPTEVSDGDDPLLGTTVAERYQIRAVLGEGGMGVVYLAEQVRPVRRWVALKLIRAGMDTRRVLTRFEGERQALALMDHPQIARVLDAGSTGPGRPFFVMDLVRGIPLTAYCDERRLDLAARLRLVQEVCLAVQHAHQKGIIHRDLKPTNILVEHREGQGVPKVIDFGLAKAVDGLPLADASQPTVFGAVAGTPLYMAPEQATFQAADVDTRADIYALGVILYELLTGSTPIRGESLADTPIDEFLRTVREADPPTPSQRISAIDDLPEVASNRRVEPARLGRLLRGELDWIVMKALAKERNRRYDSAAALADDIGRHLRHEPVLAGPPSASYRTRKFIQRYRGQVVAATLVLLALLGGVVGTSWALVVARHESIAKGEALAGEAAQRRWAEKRLGQIEQINGLLTSLFENADPDNAEDDDPRPLPTLLADRLDQAAHLIDGESIGDPVVVARLQLTLGQSQLGLGNDSQAIDLLQRSHATLRRQAGPTDPDTLVALASLARGHHKAGRIDAARPLFDEVLTTLQTQIDPGSPTILDTLDRLDQIIGLDDTARIIPIFERAIAAQRVRLGPDHPDLLSAMHNLANWYMERHQADRAVALLDQIAADRRARLGEDHPETIRTLSSLAHAQFHLDHPERAVPLFERVAAARRARLGPGHASTLQALRQLVRALRESEQPTRAAVVLDELIPLTRTHLGADHPQTLDVLHSAAVVARTVNPERAIGLFEELLATKTAKFGVDHPETVEGRLSLAHALEGVEQYHRAIPIYEQVLANRRATLGEDHLDTLSVLLLLADALKDDEQHARAIALFEECLARLQARPEPDRRKILTVQGLLAVALKNQEETARAISLFEETLAGERALLGHDHPDTFITLHNMGLALLNANQVDRAIAVFEETLAGEEAHLGVGHAETGTTLQNLAIALSRARQEARAIPLFERALAIRTANLGADHPRTLTSRHELADTLADVRQFERAIPLFEEVLILRRQKLGPAHEDTLETVRVLGKTLVEAGQAPRAVRLLEEGVEVCRTQFPGDHPTHLQTLSYLGHALRRSGEPERAVTIYEQVQVAYEAKVGPNHTDTRSAGEALVLGLQALGRFERVVAVRERGLALAAEGREADHPEVLAARNLLGLAHRDAGQFDQAIVALEAVLVARRVKLATDHPHLMASLGNLGLAYHDVGRWADAEPLLVEAVAARRRVDGPEAAATANALALLGSVILRQGRAGEAEPLLRASLAIRERREPDAWSTANNRSLLGGCLLHFGRLDEARPLLVAGFEGLKSHLKEIPHASRLRPIDAVDRLIRWAEASGQADEVQFWQGEKDRLPTRTQLRPSEPPQRP